MDVTKPYKCVWFGDIHGPEPYGFIGLRWAFISQTPVTLTEIAGRRSKWYLRIVCDAVPLLYDRTLSTVDPSDWQRSPNLVNWVGLMGGF
jgi:hypothetical protein